jgi:predicted DNA-binding transcriptional regulator AlpA
MTNTTADESKAETGEILLGWISRDTLAAELGLKPDTLSRWEARRDGPPCMRIGRKVYYRRQSVEEWMLSREQARPHKSRRGRR